MRQSCMAEMARRQTSPCHPVRLEQSQQIHTRAPFMCEIEIRQPYAIFDV